MTRILITGSTGMLGSDFVRTWLGKKGHEVYGLSRRNDSNLSARNQFQLNLEDPLPSDIATFRPDVIVHTAALTDLNQCENDLTLANKVNVKASGAIAKLAGKNTLFYYISTDSVFDGLKGNYEEMDRPNPLNAYALTKLKGEQEVLKYNKGITCIIRTNIYGFHIPMRSSLAEWAYQEWKKGNCVSGFTDIVFSAVFTNQLVSVVECMMENRIIHPILNVGSSEPISKYDFLKQLSKSLKFADGEKVKPSVSTDFPSKILRPKNTSLDTSLLSSFFPRIDLADGLQLLSDEFGKWR